MSSIFFGQVLLFLIGLLASLIAASVAIIKNGIQKDIKLHEEKSKAAHKAMDVKFQNEVDLINKSLSSLDQKMDSNFASIKRHRKNNEQFQKEMLSQILGELKNVKNP